MLDENVVQPLLVTTSALNLATECVRMILKVKIQHNLRAGVLRLPCTHVNASISQSHPAGVQIDDIVPTR